MGYLVRTRISNGLRWEALQVIPVAGLVVRRKNILLLMLQLLLINGRRRRRRKSGWIKALLSYLLESVSFKGIKLFCAKFPVVVFQVHCFSIHSKHTHSKSDSSNAASFFCTFALGALLLLQSHVSVWCWFKGFPSTVNCEISFFFFFIVIINYAKTFGWNVASHLPRQWMFIIFYSENKVSTFKYWIFYSVIFHFFFFFTI